MIFPHSRHHVKSKYVILPASSIGYRKGVFFLAWYFHSDREGSSQGLDAKTPGACHGSPAMVTPISRFLRAWDTGALLEREAPPR